jgi:hypothetical protein
MTDLLRAFSDDNERQCQTASTNDSLQRRLIKFVDGHRDNTNGCQVEVALTDYLHKLVSHDQFSSLTVDDSLINQVTNEVNNGSCSDFYRDSSLHGLSFSTDLLMISQKSPSLAAIPPKVAVTLPTTSSRGVQTDAPASAPQSFDHVLTANTAAVAQPAPQKKGFLIQSAKDMFIKEVSARLCD